MTRAEPSNAVRDAVQTPARGAPDRSVVRATDGSSTHDFHAEIGRKIDAIYGVRQEGESVVFLARCPDAGEVQLAGDFNDWMPHTTPMRRLASGDFETRLRLPQGRYRYRLVIDGRWSHDPHNPRVETNEYGEINSIAEVAVH